MRSFRSDNTAGACPEAIEAIIAANDGSHRTSYGADPFTNEAVDAFRGIFGDDCAVFFVSTGTAANTLAVAALTETWEKVVCHTHSHYNDDESTAPERITHCRTSAIHSTSSKLTPDDLRTACQPARGDVHEPQPGVVTISNATESGEVYTPDEVRALCDVAHECEYRVHVDGARFANAVAHCNCDPRELANDAGVDALSFGGTKDGLVFGEAVVFFPQGDGRAYERAVHAFPFHRKGTGHLLSKHRFVAAQFAAILRNGAWLKHAAHANTMAERLAGGLRERGIEVPYSTDANGVFAKLSPELCDRLRERGHGFYDFKSPKGQVARLMCSFDTQPEDIDAFLKDVRELL